MVSNPVLDAIRRGELSREQWRAFAVQRYLAALPFEDLLRAGAKKAREVDDEALASALEKNLRDEQGVGSDGVRHPERAHQTWRVNFYQALGVGEDRLRHAVANAGTSEYAAALSGLVGSDDSLTMAGALLVLEGTIPAEFKKIKAGRDKTFPEAFVDQASDAPEIKNRKAAARLYLDDHIAHDANDHYPDLLNALENHAADPPRAERIKRGAKAIKAAKKSFYEALEREFFDLDMSTADLRRYVRDAQVYRLPKISL